MLDAKMGRTGTMRRPHDNPFLAGNYAPVHDELDVAGLEIEGRLPEALSGVYMRNGPNPYFEPLHRFIVRLDGQLGAYIRGVLLVALCVGSVATVTLS